MSPAIIVNPKSSEQPKALIAWLFLAIGILVMYVPSFLNLFQHVWNTDRQAHGPIVLAVSLWFFYFKLKSFKTQHIQISPSPLLGWSILVVGVIMYVVGRSQGVLVFDVGSLILVLLGLISLLFGHSVARYFWFGFFFMLFVIPLPASLVDTITQPMKIAVSYCAVHLLYWLNYPAAREGVVIFIGQYQLLVADACSGLNSLFTLEALGLLYMNISRHESAFRNALLALLIIPISFASNVTRVIVLALITYHWGDEAGQGFLHEFSGLVLFLTALIIIIGVDSMLRAIVMTWKKWRNA